MLGFILKTARSHDEGDLNGDVRVDLRWEGSSDDNVEDRQKKPERADGYCNSPNSVVRT